MEYILIFIAAVFVNNVVLAQFLGFITDERRGTRQVAYPGRYVVR